MKFEAFLKYFYPFTGAMKERPRRKYLSQFLPVDKYLPSLQPDPVIAEQILQI